MRHTASKALVRSLTVAAFLYAVALLAPGGLFAWVPAPEYQSRQVQIQRQSDLRREVQRLRADQMSRDLKQEIRALKDGQDSRRLQREMLRLRQTKTSPPQTAPAVLQDPPAQPALDDKPQLETSPY